MHFISKVDSHFISIKSCLADPLNCDQDSTYKINIKAWSHKTEPVARSLCIVR